MVDHRLLLRFESGAGHIEKVTIDASEHTENYYTKLMLESLAFKKNIGNNWQEQQPFIIDYNVY